MESQNTILDEDKARAFLEDEDSIDLSEMTSITDDAAEILSKHEGYLYLNGLTSLTDAAAESLSKVKGDLGLSGLTSLTDAAAESLSKVKGALYLKSALTSQLYGQAESMRGGAELTRKIVEELGYRHPRYREPVDSADEYSLTILDLSDFSSIHDDWNLEEWFDFGSYEVLLDGVKEMSAGLARVITDNLYKSPARYYFRGLEEIDPAFVENFICMGKGNIIGPTGF